MASPVASGISAFPLSGVTGPIGDNLPDMVDQIMQVVNAQCAPIVAGIVAPTGGAITVTAALSGQTILMNTLAGTVATLPAATGSGARYRFVNSVTLTSGANKILAASSSDFINGLAIGENANTCKAFASAAATNHSIQMPFTGSQPSGGFIGDYFEFTDIAANLWQCNGMYQAGTTPTTPFSSATS